MAYVFYENANEVPDDLLNSPQSQGFFKKFFASKSDEEKPKIPRVSFLALFRYATFLDYIFIMLACIGAVIHGMILPAFSFLFGELIDAFNEGDITKEVNRVCLWFVIAAIVAWIATWMQTAFFMLSSERQMKLVREQYLQSILRQEVGWYDKTGAGEITSRLQSDAVIMQGAMGEKLGQFIYFMSTFIGGLGVGFFRGWELTLVLIAVTPLLMAAGAFMVYMMTTMTAKGQQSYAEAGSIAQEVLSGIATVASFSAEALMLSKYEVKLKEARKVAIKKGFSLGFGLGLTMFIFFLTYAVAFYYGAVLIADGNYTGGDVLAVFFGVVMGGFALGQGMPQLQSVAEGQGAAFKIYETIDRTPEIQAFDDESGQKPSKSRGSVTVKNLHFAYPTRPEAEVLRGVSFKVKAGSTVALVGESGSGKSSIIQLLQRFYDPAQGSIEFDGVNIKDLNITWFRQQVALVGQEPVLFSGSIAQNIAFGVEGNINDMLNEIEEAARRANAHDFIMQFPDQYNTQVGERGAQLSGGQKQRIAIARALMKKPKLLLLDEATSALDSRSEKTVQSALDAIMKDVTTIVIAHRLSTIRNADNIVVIDRGQVSEVGNHAQLMKHKGIYAKLVSLQQLDDEDNKSRGFNDSLDISALSVGKSEISLSHSNEEHKQLTLFQKLFKKKPKDADEDERKDVSLGRLYRLNAPEWPYLVMGTFFAALNGSVNPVFAIIFAEVMDAFYGPKDQVEDDVEPYVLGFCAVAVGVLIANVGQAGLFGMSGEYLTERIRSISMRSILRQEVGWFDMEENSVGKLTSRLSSDATLVQGLVGVSLGINVQNTVTIIFGMTIAFIYGWQLTLVILAVSPLFVVGSAMEFLSMRGFSSASTKAHQKASISAVESVTNIRTVYSFTRQSIIVNSYQTRLKEPLRLAKTNANFIGCLVGISQGIMFLVYALSFWYGGQLVEDNKMSFRDVMLVFFAIVMSAWSVGQTSSVAPDTPKAKEAAKSVFALIDRQPIIDIEDESGEKLSHQDCKGAISFKKVSFAYPSRPAVDVLDKLSIQAKQGKVVALCGTSGSGKSSIVKLISRFYNPKSGSISLDGRSIADYSLKSYRKLISMVGQEPVLFTGTIAENIKLGKPNASMKEVEKVAKMANAYKFIADLSSGFHTRLGEKGIQLSGGQKQRIAIARAMLMDPRVLLLDEATSALDTESEAVVQDALNVAMRGRTTIVIAHRLSTIRDADLIYVVDKGQILEKGSHSQLVAKGGHYAKMVSQQKL